MLEQVERALKRHGIDIWDLQVDHQNQQTFEAVERRMQPGFLFRPGHEKHFYRTLIRWRIGKAERGLMLIDPVIKRGSNGVWYEDQHAEAEDLIGKIVAHYAEKPAEPN